MVEMEFNNYQFDLLMSIKNNPAQQWLQQKFQTDA